MARGCRALQKILKLYKILRTKKQRLYESEGWVMKRNIENELNTWGRVLRKILGGVRVEGNELRKRTSLKELYV